MRTHRASLTLAAAAIAAGLAAAHPAWAEPPAATQTMTIAQAGETEPGGAPPPDPKTLTNPNANKPVTAAEVAECMKSWDPQTGMSKDDYEKSCRDTLKYFPEKTN